MRHDGLRVGPAFALGRRGLAHTENDEPAGASNSHATAGRAQAAIHVDLDGARHIYRAHGWPYDSGDDRLFESGLRGALDFLAGAECPATFFAIAEDLDDFRKRALLEGVVDAGHEIASHSVTHRRLTGLDRETKRHEIAESRRRLASALRVAVRGFRAPGFGIDHECLELIQEAGYEYDSSMWDVRHANGRLPGPFQPLPGEPLVEMPVPAAGPFGWPFHPSYSLAVGDWYFRAGLRAFRRRQTPMVLLFHLTDFSDPLPRAHARGFPQRLFTLSTLSAEGKRARCRAMLDLVRRHFVLATTSDLLEAARAVPSRVASRN